VPKAVRDVLFSPSRRGWLHRLASETEKGVPVFTVTDAAARKLYEMIKDDGLNGDTCWRVQATSLGLGFTIGKERPDDNAISHADTTVLVWDATVAHALNGRTLDLKETKNGTRVILTSHTQKSR
jgi:hypothetical protein